jgi:hypothetical protein
MISMSLHASRQRFVASWGAPHVALDDVVLLAQLLRFVPGDRVQRRSRSALAVSLEKSRDAFLLEQLHELVKGAMVRCAGHFPQTASGRTRDTPAHEGDRIIRR